MGTKPRWDTHISEGELAALEGAVVGRSVDLVAFGSTFEVCQAAHRGLPLRFLSSAKICFTERPSSVDRALRAYSLARGEAGPASA